MPPDDTTPRLTTCRYCRQSVPYTESYPNPPRCRKCYEYGVNGFAHISEVLDFFDLNTVPRPLTPFTNVDRFVSRQLLWEALEHALRYNRGVGATMHSELVALRRARDKIIRRRKAKADPVLAQQVRARDGDTCRYCGVLVTPETRTLDHVTPVHKDGRTDAENLVVACRPCNNKKGRRNPADAGMTILPLAGDPSAAPDVHCWLLPNALPVERRGAKKSPNRQNRANPNRPD